MARRPRPRIIDLTRPIVHEMPNFPGEPRPGFLRFGGLGDLGFRCHQVVMPTHFGTHADAYNHFLAAGLPIDRMQPRQYVGPALLLDLRRRSDPKQITRADLLRAWPRGDRARRVVLNTGWATRAKGARYFKGFPGLTRDAATWLVGRSVLMLGLDLPSVHPADYTRVHQILFRGGVAVVEGLVGLNRVATRWFFFVGLPLPLRGLDGSPVRALAIVGSPDDL